MRAFALGLDLPEDFFVKEMDINDPENGTTMNNNYYPSLENVDLPPGTLRIYSHCDYEVLSLLHTRPGQSTAASFTLLASISAWWCTAAIRS